jgi:hypothetical protein
MTSFLSKRKVNRNITKEKEKSRAEMKNSSNQK